MNCIEDFVCIVSWLQWNGIPFSYITEHFLQATNNGICSVTTCCCL